MDIEVSYVKANAINRAGLLFYLWYERAIERGVDYLTTRTVWEDWREGKFKLIVPLEDWAQIQ